MTTIGILPTLELNDLGPGTLSDAARYRALANGLLRIKREPFRVLIEAEEAISVRAHDVTFEGATTSLQVHLRVEPEVFARTYNAAQLATGVALAASCNAPCFLGKRLWHETRVALFKQSVDDRTGAPEEDWRPGRVSPPAARPDADRDHAAARPLGAGLRGCGRGRCRGLAVRRA